MYVQGFMVSFFDMVVRDIAADDVVQWASGVSSTNLDPKIIRIFRAPTTPTQNT